MRSDPKQFWRALKRGKRPTQGLPDISDTELFNHFASLNGTVPDMTSDFDTQIRATIQRDHGDGDVILDSVITMDEVSTAITHMKSGKAAGVDRLIPELFIHGKDILLPYLTALLYPRNLKISVILWFWLRRRRCLRRLRRRRRTPTLVQAITLSHIHLSNSYSP